jgi:hypothetical protein
VIYKIHPSIGFARVGNSEEYYLAPETAGGLPILPGGGVFTPPDFRDADRRMRRQGARFEVFRYDEHRPSRGSAVRPGRDGVARIEWTVHLANKKPIWYQFLANAGEAGYAPDHPLRNAAVRDPAERVRLIIDPGPRTLTDRGQRAEFSRFDNPHGYPMTFPPEELRPRRIDSLGGIRTDDEGRLVVLGGYGASGSSAPQPVIVDYANNDAWWDDVSDGPVTARVILEDGSAVDVDDGAWAVVGPPRFAPQLVNLVSLYDTMFDVAVREFGTRPDIFADSLWNRDYRPSWEREVRPIVERAHHYQWVVAIPPHPHNFEFDKLADPDPRYNPLRAFYLELVRPPDRPNLLVSADTGLTMMPYLAGDNVLDTGTLASNYLTLTATQYFFLQQWADGKFGIGAVGHDEGGGATVDRAALENAVGGAFMPGIEVTWISRNPAIYEAPFRIRRKRDVRPPLSLGQDFAEGLEPGDLGKYMAVPWQADFNECAHQPIGDRVFWWWPVQRPHFVYVRRGAGLKQVAWVGSDVDQNAADYIQFPDDIQMVEHWQQLGFVFNEGTRDKPRFVEVERVLRGHRTELHPG